jgi:hypothetical protein
MKAPEITMTTSATGIIATTAMTRERDQKSMEKPF